MPRSSSHLLLAAAALALTGCLTVPDDLKAAMEQPDGKRPNNFGKAVPAEDWEGKDDGRGAADEEVAPFKVVPDTPTIARADAAPVASQSKPEGSK
jgi:hypothetical protein